MKKKIIIISTIAVLVVSVASVAGVWAYGETITQVQEDALQATSVVDEPTAEISFDDKIVECINNGHSTVDDILSLFEIEHEQNARLIFWEASSEDHQLVGSYDGSDIIQHSCRNFFESSHDGYALVSFLTIENDYGRYYIMFAPTKSGDAAVFRVEKAYEKSSKYGLLNNKNNIIYYDPDFEFVFGEEVLLIELYYRYATDEKFKELKSLLNRFFAYNENFIIEKYGKEYALWLLDENETNRDIHPYTTIFFDHDIPDELLQKVLKAACIN